MYAKDGMAWHGMNRAALLGHNTRISSSLCDESKNETEHTRDKEKHSQTLDASVFVWHCHGKQDRCAYMYVLKCIALSNVCSLQHCLVRICKVVVYVFLCSIFRFSVYKNGERGTCTVSKSEQSAVVGDDMRLLWSFISIWNVHRERTQALRNARINISEKF